MRPLDDLTVIFDLDGTLVDSAPDLTATLNHVLKQLGREPVSLGEVRHLVGQGAAAMLRHGLANNDEDAFSEEAMAHWLDQFIAHYKVHIADNSLPFAGVTSCLEYLVEQGARLAICTNKREELALPLLKTLKLEGWFDTIVGRDTLAQYKPAPEPLRACVERTGTQYGVMVGDSLTDYRAAKAAPMRCYLFTGGYWWPQDPWPSDATRFDHFDHLAKIIVEEFQSDRRS